MGTAEQLVERLRERVREQRIATAEEALAALKAEMLELLQGRDRGLRLDARPSVVLVVLGTRPEAIKLVPVVRELGAHPDLAVKVVATAHSRAMNGTR